MKSLIASEIRRCLSRRVVRGLIALALLMTAIAGVLIFFNTAAAPTTVRHGHEPLRLAELWSPSGEDSILLAPFVLLAIGALLGAASVIGGEWKHGTMAALLCFESRRGRVAAAKFIAMAVTGMAVAAGLLVVFAAALTPTLIFHGDTSGVDGAWWLSVGLSVIRALVLVAIATAISGSVALAARNTGAVLVGVFLYAQVVEQSLMAWKPWLAEWALTANIASFMTWEPLRDLERAPTPGGAALRLVLYATVAMWIAVTLFRRRDVLGPA